VRRLPSSVRQLSSVPWSYLENYARQTVSYCGTLFGRWRRRLCCRTQVRLSHPWGYIRVLNTKHVHKAFCSSWRQTTSVVNRARPFLVLIKEMRRSEPVVYNRCPLVRTTPQSNRRQPAYFCSEMYFVVKTGLHLPKL